jgi:serpin B
MIDRILETIPDDVIMYLINAILFDAEWASVYYDNAVHEGVFTDIQGNLQTVDFMHSTEWQYLDDGKATGFLKPYAGGHYSFAALLPNEDIPIEDYIASLTGAGFLDTIQNAQNTQVQASMPKFEYEYSISLVHALQSLGMTDAFDMMGADFSRMASLASGEPIYVSEVLHKTFIAVDQRGTRAGAVTMVAMEALGGMILQEMKIVNLDRPFVFAIIDNTTNLPLFIGTLMTV